jgi:PIN domain nuclease of toxin-antitoxin system
MTSASAGAATEGIRIILDASAMLAWLGGEEGSDLVAQEIAGGGCAISAVNLAEVLGKLADHGQDPHATSLQIAAGLIVVDFNEELATDTARLRAIMGRRSSLADRACIATARVDELPVLTADRAWVAIHDLGVSVISIR